MICSTRIVPYASDMFWSLLGMVLLWKVVRYALMPQCKSRQEQKEWQLSHPPFRISENESENLQVFITKRAAKSVKIKWLLPIKGIDCWQYPSTYLFSYFWLLFLPVNPPCSIFLTSAKVTDMMQKALFDFLKHRFDGRWEILSFSHLFSPCVTNILVWWVLFGFWFGFFFF